MKRRIMRFLFVCIVLIGLVGCETNDHIQDVKLTKDGKAFVSASINEDAAIFKHAIELTAESGIPYVKTGEQLTLEFGDVKPDLIRVEDSIVNPDGTLRYTEKEIVDIEIAEENGLYAFVVNKHFASALSNKFSIDKKDLRGFKVTAIKGNLAIVRTFVIQSDSY